MLEMGASLGYQRKSSLPLVGPIRKDVSNWEWRYFLPFLKRVRLASSPPAALTVDPGADAARLRRPRRRLQPGRLGFGEGAAAGVGVPPPRLLPLRHALRHIVLLPWVSLGSLGGKGWLRYRVVLNGLALALVLYTGAWASRSRFVVWLLAAPLIYVNLGTGCPYPTSPLSINWTGRVLA